VLPQIISFWASKSLFWASALSRAYRLPRTRPFGQGHPFGQAVGEELQPVGHPVQLSPKVRPYSPLCEFWLEPAVIYVRAPFVRKWAIREAISGR